MENWQESSTLFIWVIYILVAAIVIGGFVMYLIRKNLIEKNRQKKELSLLEEKHLKDLLNKHIQTQEYERERIGSNLHDSISNKLNMILLKLRVSSNKTEIENDINETIHAVRRIAHDLNPPLIDKIPMDVLIFSQFDRLVPEYEVIKWNNYSNKTIWNTNFKIQLIRILQELVTNILKHSKATTITVKLRENGKKMLISVEDNGAGFSHQAKGMGLKNIENRIFIIGGTFKIISEAGKGTKVVMALNNGI